MLYVPGTTLSTPIVLQAQPTYVPAAPYYYAVPQPTIPLVNASFVYQKPQLVSVVNRDDLQIKADTNPVQHIVHHHIVPCPERKCSGYCDLCCPCVEQPRPRSKSPVNCEKQERYSRRDDFEKDTFKRISETLDEKIERLRIGLQLQSVSKRDQSTETIDFYRPPPTPPKPVELTVPYKQHYDAPKPRLTRSRSRSASSRRTSPLPREPWLSTNKNDYTWRDAHLPGYRAASQCHSAKSVDKSTKNYSSNREFVYRPPSETEARKWYVQTTGKNPDCDVYNSLNHCKQNTTVYECKPTATIYECKPTTTSCCKSDSYTHSFYTSVPPSYTCKKVSFAPAYNVNASASNDSCLHIMPKNSNTLETPYLKVLNSPVTYIH